MSIKPRLLPNSARRGLFSVLFFLISILSFFGLIFGAIGVEIERNTKEEIEREYTHIIQDLNESPEINIEQLVTYYISKANSEQAIYILKVDGGIRQSNYPFDVSLSEGWQYLNEIEDAAGESDLIPKKVNPKGYIGKVSSHGGKTLFVGRSLASIDETRDVFVRLAMFVLPLSLILAGLGGYLLDRMTLRRIEVINEQCRAIRQKGDLSLRIPNKKPDDEYGLLIANINAMLDTIDKSVQNIQVVSDDVAHDLRTPLSRLKYSLEAGLLDEKLNKKELRSIIDSSLVEIDSLLDTFSATLRISQLNAGRRKSKFQDFNLSELVIVMVEAYEPIAEEKGHELTYDLHIQECQMVGDKDMVTQVISNLIENCFSHGGEKLKIVLKVECKQDEIVLSVSDTGVGVTASESRKIFNKFYRADKSRSSRGSGLGLAIVKAVSELHGGNISASDNKPGLVISIRFPRRLKPS